MATLTESVLVQASLAETWGYYFEPSGWPAWVDGFHAVESAIGYPDEGGTLVWRSTPAGRGTVTERVLVHEPRKLHRIAFEDPESSGELTTRHVTLVQAAKGGQVEEGGRQRPRQEHLQRVEISNVVALVLEDGVELLRRGGLQQAAAHRHPRGDRSVGEREPLWRVDE